MTFDADTLGTALSGVSSIIGLSKEEIAEARDREGKRLADWVRKLSTSDWANPTYAGAIGHTWRIELDEAKRHFRIGPEWFVLIPRAHPFWPHYLLSCVHLRPDPTYPPQLRFPEATHELIMQALNPERNPVPNNPATWEAMTPANVIEQFQVSTDEQAAHVVELVARALVDGHLPAECDDYIGSRDLWRSSVQTTAEHTRSGQHD